MRRSAATRRTRRRRATRATRRMRLDHYQNGRHRLTSPLRRRADGSFEEVGWDHGHRGSPRACRRPRHPWRRDDLLLRRRWAGEPPGGAYSGALLRALGARLRSSALAQEKTGESGYVGLASLGGHTRGDFEHCRGGGLPRQEPMALPELPRARVTLREMARDPERTLIVLDPARTQTAELADIHLRVQPGTDALCLAALLGDARTGGPRRRNASCTRTASDVDAVVAALAEVPVERYAARCGVDEQLIRAAAAADRGGRSVSLVRGPGHPAGAAQPDLVLLPEQAAMAADRELRQAGGDASPFAARAARAPRRLGPPHAGDRRADHRRARAVQRDRRRDPHRPPSGACGR